MKTYRECIVDEGKSWCKSPEVGAAWLSHREGAQCGKDEEQRQSAAEGRLLDEVGGVHRALNIMVL